MNETVPTAPRANDETPRPIWSRMSVRPYEVIDMLCSFAIDFRLRSGNDKFTCQRIWREIPPRSVTLPTLADDFAASCPSGYFAAGALQRFCFSEYTNPPISPVIPSHKRGVSRSSWTRGGMRWTLGVLLTRALEADGKGVWFWHPDAGVKSA